MYDVGYITEVAKALGILMITGALAYAIFVIAPSIGRAIDKVPADEITCGIEYNEKEHIFTTGIHAKSTNAKSRPTLDSSDGKEK